MRVLRRFTWTENDDFAQFEKIRSAYTRTRARESLMHSAISGCCSGGRRLRLGVVDRDRIGVTGHSHGALMTANLVAHTDLFRAGVATSGAYNKTLTPFGFQNESRSVWNAQDVYLKVSPYFYANKMHAPLLLVHGADDANPGTTPIQSEQLFQAIHGNGGTVRPGHAPPRTPLVRRDGVERTTRLRRTALVR
jgi:dienelactone hydrolase